MSARSRGTISSSLESGYTTGRDTYRTNLDGKGQRVLESDGVSVDGEGGYESLLKPFVASEEDGELAGSFGRPRSGEGPLTFDERVQLLR